MTGSGIVSFFALVAYAVIGFLIIRSVRRKEEEEEPDDFEYLTVREQIAAAKTVSDKIGDLEQLRTDLTESTPDDVLSVRIEWIGRDNTAHTYDLICTGYDTASECLAEAAARESHLLRQELAKQCAALERSTQNDTQNSTKPRGEWDLDQAMRGLREDDFVR